MIQAVIFDLDGTVLDNSGVWQEVFSEVAQKNNIASFVHTPGIGILNNWKKYVQDEVLAEKLSVETKKMYLAENENKEVLVRAGLVELLEGIREKGWQTALATGTEWYVVEKELEQLNLYLAFDITTTGDEVLAQKPDPEIYLLSVQKLGLEPAECVVIEDAVAGVEAGVDAGCQVVGIANPFADEKSLRAAGATYIVDTFDKVLDELVS